MSFSSKQIQFLLSLMREKYGSGYADDPEVAALQARLSIMLEMARREERSERAEGPPARARRRIKT